MLNAPTVTSGISATANVKIMGKFSDGKLYIFAGSAGGSGQAAFSVPNGTTATVLGENRSVPISGGLFSDNFVDANAIHIYRID